MGKRNGCYIDFKIDKQGDPEILLLHNVLFIEKYFIA